MSTDLVNSIPWASNNNILQDLSELRQVTNILLQYDCVDKTYNSACSQLSFKCVVQFAKVVVVIFWNHLDDKESSTSDIVSPNTNYATDNCVSLSYSIIVQV